MIGRRRFLLSAAALAGTACARVRAPLRAPTTPRLPLGFSTLGAPRWGWQQILDAASTHGYPVVELRGLAGEMDLTKRPEFAAGRIATTRRELEDRELGIICLGASANLHELDTARRAAHLDEARRFIDLAAALGAPYVRVFGDRYVTGESPEATRIRIGRGLRELGERARAQGVTVLIESHGHFTDSAALADILGHADTPGAALLWDAHHTFVYGKEEPELTVDRLARWIRHTHLKDSVITAGGGRRYVLTGTGEVPIDRQVAALARSGYTGYYSFEWEKGWHPEIEEPEIAIPHFARVASEYLVRAGVSRRPLPR